MFDKILKKPATLPAVRLTQRLGKALSDQMQLIAKNERDDAARAGKRIKAFAQLPTHDAMARAGHQQAVAAATAPMRPSVKTAASHVQAALKGPSPGLQLRSVRVAPAEASGGPKQHSFAWRAPKAR